MRTVETNALSLVAQTATFAFFVRKDVLGHWCVCDGRRMSES